MIVKKGFWFTELCCESKYRLISQYCMYEWWQCKDVFFLYLLNVLRRALNCNLYTSRRSIWKKSSENSVSELLLWHFLSWWGRDASRPSPYLASFMTKVWLRLWWGFNRFLCQYHFKVTATRLANITRRTQIVHRRGRRKRIRKKT